MSPEIPKTRTSKYRIRFVIYNPKPWVAEVELEVNPQTEIKKWVHLSEHADLQAAVTNVVVQAGNDVIIPLEISSD